MVCAATCGWTNCANEKNLQLRFLTYTFSGLYQKIMKTKTATLLCIAVSICTNLNAQTYIPPDHKGEPASSAISFYRNDGQVIDTDGNFRDDVKFESWQTQPKLYVRKNHILSFVASTVDGDTATQDSLFRVDLIHAGEVANHGENPATFDETGEVHNYILGHCPNGILNVPAFKRIVYKEIYTKIDFHIWSNPWGLKFYYVVHPGGNPNLIKWQFEGHDSLKIDNMYALKVFFKSKHIKLPEALVYQESNGQTNLIPWAANYVQLNGVDEVGFQFGNYDPSLPLILDISASLSAPPPPLYTPEWGTYYGDGLADGIESVNDLYLGKDDLMLTCGVTRSIEFPTLFEIQQYQGQDDGFFSKFNDQYHREFTTFYGGTNFDELTGISVNGDGSKIVVCGNTNSSPGTLQTVAYGNAFYDDQHVPTAKEGLIAMFDIDPSFPLWSTRFGNQIEIKKMLFASYNLYIAGKAINYNGTFPVQSTCNGTYATFPICDPGQSAYIQNFHAGEYFAGAVLKHDIFVARFNEDLELDWSTLFGGKGYDVLYDMTLTDKDLVIAGYTNAEQGSYNSCSPPDPIQRNFPLCNNGTGYFQDKLNGNNVEGGGDGFVAAFNTNNNRLEYCTLIGGNGHEQINALAFNRTNKTLYFVGEELLGGIVGTPFCSTPTNNGFPQCFSGPQYTAPALANFNAIWGGLIVDENDVGTKYKMKWSTYAGNWTPRDLTTDISGNTFAAGVTYGGCQGNTPVVIQPHPSYYQQPLHGDLLAQSCNDDGYVIGLRHNESMLMATYFGGIGPDNISAIAASTEPGQKRLYLGGDTRTELQYPYNCPPTVQPYCSPNISYNSNGVAVDELHYAQLLFDETISIQEHAGSSYSGISIHPNPANENIQVMWPEHLLNGQEGQMIILDIGGRLLWSSSINQNSTNSVIDVRHLSEGIYILQLASESGTSMNVKFIK